MARGMIPHRVMLSLILLVIVLLVMIVYGTGLFKRGDSYADAQTCRDSIQRNSQLRFGGIQFSSRISCPIEDIKLSGDDDAIKARVAQELYQCWNTWGEGRLELFDPKDETFCAVCSIITFEDKNEKIAGLLPYLAQRVVPGGKETYFEYLTGVSVTEATRTNLANPEVQKFDVIDTAQPLSIVFTYAKDAQLSKKEGLIWGVGIGTAIGIATGVVLLVVFPPAGVSVLGVTIVSAATIGTVALTAGALGGAIGGGLIGYELGHDTSATWDAHLLAIPYTAEQLTKRGGCTYFPASQSKAGAGITV